MHLNENSRKKLLTYFINLGGQFKQSLFDKFIKSQSSLAKLPLKHNNSADVRVAISAADIYFVEVLIEQIILHFDSTRAKKKIRNINRDILKHSSLMYGNSKIYKLGAFAQVSSFEVNGQTYARKELIDISRTSLLKHEIDLMQDVTNRCASDGISPFSVKVIRSTEHSYDMNYYEFDLEDYVELTLIREDNKRNLVMQLASIAKHLHDFGILHRDWHPGNLLIDNKPDKPILLISDFGLSRYKHERTDMHRYLEIRYGREKYISSKQRDNLSNCDIKTELFSVGRLINFIMTKDPANFNHVFRNITRKTDIFEYEEIWYFMDEIYQLFS